MDGCWNVRGKANASEEEEIEERQRGGGGGATSESRALRQPRTGKPERKPDPRRRAVLPIWLIRNASQIARPPGWNRCISFCLLHARRALTEAGPRGGDTEHQLVQHDALSSPAEFRGSSLMSAGCMSVAKCRYLLAPSFLQNSAGLRGRAVVDRRQHTTSIRLVQSPES